MRTNPGMNNCCQGEGNIHLPGVLQVYPEDQDLLALGTQTVQLDPVDPWA